MLQISAGAGNGKELVATILGENKASEALTK
jgi:hypothetical protein